MRRIGEVKTKSLPITEQMVITAYKKVKSNQGSSGVDAVSLSAYEQDLGNNLYKLWNRLCSGSYFPPSVREVMIPKANGKQRKLGIPTVSDRIAQQVIKHYLEPRLEAVFHESSYGYRPHRSTHHAIEAVRNNVRHYRWVVDMDIQSFFDEVSHDLLMKALERHVEEPWVKMYIKRWLESPVRTPTGEEYTKEGKGTPQGGVVSPLLANLYLHYALDKWLLQKYKHLSFVRYADDVIIHCSSETEAKAVLANVKERLRTCRLKLNEGKTKIVYCQDYRRVKKSYPKQFDFLGFRFKPRATQSKWGGLFLGYDCAISPKVTQRIAKGWKTQKFHSWVGVDIVYLANKFNPQLRGVIQYFGKYRKWALEQLLKIFHLRLAKWALNKYKRFGRSYKKAYQWLRKVCESYPNLFYHWSIGFKTM